MALFRTNNGYNINTKYIVMTSKIDYNNTADRYFFVVYLMGNSPFNISLEHSTKEEAEFELNRLIREMA